ncbi:MAG: hypothetical protein NPIRA06_30270 [Nitrospirales bacterium]|nr:MAG: hypothetical protein NPIRA06_30270 [Nitrospirales bacterium]
MKHGDGNSLVPFNRHACFHRAGFKGMQKHELLEILSDEKDGSALRSNNLQRISERFYLTNSSE